MEIANLISGPIQNNVYIVYDESNECIIIDAAFGCCDALLQFINDKNLILKYILLTHGHGDHIGDLAKLKRATNVPIVIHRADEYRLQIPEDMGFKIEPTHADILLNGGETLQFGNTKFKVVSTPGHTEGGVCYIFEKEKIIFSGDTLFNGSIGRTDFDGGDFNTLIKSIKEKLFILSDDYCIYTGHGEPTSLKDEKLYNPYLT